MRERELGPGNHSKVLETVPKKNENSIVKNQSKSKSLIITGSKIFTGQSIHVLSGESDYLLD